MSLGQCVFVSVSLHPRVCVQLCGGSRLCPQTYLCPCHPLSLNVGCAPVRLSVSACACLVSTLQVTQHIATCQPLSGALDNGRVVLCDMMADPWVSASSSSGLVDFLQACTPDLPLSPENASPCPSLTQWEDWGWEEVAA